MGFTPDRDLRGRRRMTVNYSIDLVREGLLRLTFNLETIIGPRSEEFQAMLAELGWPRLTVRQQGGGYSIQGPPGTGEDRLRGAFDALARQSNWITRHY